MEWASDGFVAAMVALCCLIFLAVIPSLLKVYPALVQTLFRARAHQRLCVSVNQSLCRDYVAASMFLPCVLLTARYHLHPLVLQTGTFAAVASSAGLLLAYCLLRALLDTALRGKMSSEAYRCSSTLPRTLFAAAALIELLSAGIFSYFGASDGAVRSVILWETAVFYAICLVRRYQIFAQYSGYFSGFLYLCTLEFFPTGILVGSAAFL